MNKKFGKNKSSKSKRPRDLKDDGTSRMTPPPDKPTVDVSYILCYCTKYIVRLILFKINQTFTTGSLRIRH